MRFTPLSIAGAYVIDPEPIEDHRGFNARVYCEHEFAQHGLATRMVQTNLIVNGPAGTLRGFHWQAPPKLESKLFRCTRGAMFDVIIDMRPDSRTFERHETVELTADNRRMLYVPEQMAQGFMTLEDDTEVTYQVSGFHSPGVEQGIRWDDPYFAIPWPAEVTTISGKDAGWPDYEGKA